MDLSSVVGLIIGWKRFKMGTLCIYTMYYTQAYGLIFGYLPSKVLGVCGGGGALIFGGR